MTPTMDPSPSAPERIEHLSGYQARDREIVDYEMYELAGTALQFRGPAPAPASLDSGEYFTCIGAAQTFGCFCATPFPILLARRLGLPALNFGYGGAGPEFFARQRVLIDSVNRGKFLVLQVMSGRSQSNSLFESGGLEYLVRRSDGAALGANQAYADLLAGSRAIRALSFGPATRAFARLAAAPRARRVAAETRAAWIESHRRLLAQITVPVVLFWFSKRTPDLRFSIRSVNTFFGEFPQLIDRTTVEAVKSLCACYVECVSSRGSPQLLISRFTGQPTTVDPANDRPDLGGTRWTHNHYYPSPEMQEDAAEALFAPCRGLLQNHKPAV